MRVVGASYILLFAVGAIVKLPVTQTLAQGGLELQPDSLPHRLLVDTRFMFALELGVIDAALRQVSANAYQNRILLWTVLALEVGRGILDDICLLARGYERAFYIGWLVIHSPIIASGLWALRRAASQAPAGGSGSATPA